MLALGVVVAAAAYGAGALAATGHERSVNPLASPSHVVVPAGQRPRVIFSATLRKSPRRRDGPRGRVFSAPARPPSMA